MDGFVPGLKEAVISVSAELRVVVFLVCVAGLMVQIAKARPEIDSLTEPIVRAVIVLGLIATLPAWFEMIECLMLNLANTIQQGYTEHPMKAATLVRDAVKDGESLFSFARIGESVYKAVLWAAAKFVVIIGSVLQLPLLLLQHVLKLLCYLFLPVALSLFMVPSLSSLAARYVQQTLAVLAWPIGFAVTELVAFNLITSYQTNIAIAVGVSAGEIDPSSMASVLGGLLGALWLILGTLGTPVLMQMLFCSGAPVTAGGQSALQQLYTLQQVSWMVKSLKTGGAAAVLAASSQAARTGGGATPPIAETNPPVARGAGPAPEIPKPQTTL